MRVSKAFSSLMGGRAGVSCLGGGGGSPLHADVEGHNNNNALIPLSQTKTTMPGLFKVPQFIKRKGATAHVLAKAPPSAMGRKSVEDAPYDNTGLIGAYAPPPQQDDTAAFDAPSSVELHRKWDEDSAHLAQHIRGYAGLCGMLSATWLDDLRLLDGQCAADAVYGGGRVPHYLDVVDGAVAFDAVEEEEDDADDDATQSALLAAALDEVARLQQELARSLATVAAQEAQMAAQAGDIQALTAAGDAFAAQFQAYVARQDARGACAGAEVSALSQHALELGAHYDATLADMEARHKAELAEKDAALAEKDALVGALTKQVFNLEVRMVEAEAEASDAAERNDALAQQVSELEELRSDQDARHEELLAALLARGGGGEGSADGNDDGKEEEDACTPLPTVPSSPHRRYLSPSRTPSLDTIYEGYSSSSSESDDSWSSDGSDSEDEDDVTPPSLTFPALRSLVDSPRPLPAAAPADEDGRSGALDVGGHLFTIRNNPYWLADGSSSSGGSGNSSSVHTSSSPSSSSHDGGYVADEQQRVADVRAAGRVSSKIRSIRRRLDFSSLLRRP